MKKLMIAAAIVCVAAFAQAAACNWSANNGYTIDATGKTVTKANAADYQVIGLLFVDQTKSTILADLASGDDAKVAAAIAKGVNPLTSKGTAMFSGTTSADGYTPSDHTAFVVIFNAKTTDDANYFWASDEMTKTLSDASPTTFGFGNLTSSTQSKPINVAGNWTAMSSVPEPTSGLLLLLGVAGLALRRRRA